MYILNKNYPEIFTIADAKRGDIGNTSKMYAQSFFTEMNFDSLTINPYMGSDSVKPFLEFKNKIFRCWCNGLYAYEKHGKRLRMGNEQVLWL